MANYQFSSDLISDILFRAGEPVDTAGARTSDFGGVALTYLNRAYQALWMGGAELEPSIHEEWAWLRKDPPGVLTLLPYTIAGTVSVTNNSTAITFSSAPTPSVANYFFQVDGNADVFRISTHTAGAAAAVLDAVYTGATAGTATYKLMKLEYALATDVLRVSSPMRVYQENKSYIDGVSLPQLEWRWPLNVIQTGVPEAFALITETKVRFNRAGLTSTTGYIRVEYDYLYKPADLTDGAAEEPAVPRQWRKVLADTALFFLHMDMNDNRADAVGLMAKSGLSAMARENRYRAAAMSRTLGKIMPRPTFLPENFAPLRTESGLIIG